MKKPIAERIAAVKARQDQLANRLTALQAKAKTDERKRDTRRKIIVGAAVLATVEKNPALKDSLRRILDAAVTRPQDRDILSDFLPPVQPAAPAPSQAPAPTEAG